jgi:hypothetical protein
MVVVYWTKHAIFIINMEESMKRVLLSIAMVAAASLACSLLSPTVASTNAQPTTQSNILFADDFSSSSSGWAEVDEAAKFAGYTNGGYRMWLNTAQYDIWAYPGKSFDGPVSIEVDATKTAGPDNNDFGVICDFQDSENFYFGLISSDGYALIGKKQGGTTTPLSAEQMVPVDGILAGNMTNHIKFVCNNGDLSLYANSNLVASTTDTTFSSGDVGLRVGTYDEIGVDMLFDNFVVTKP